MFEAQKVDELSRKISDLVPHSVREMQGELQQNVKALLQGALSQMNLVTREEFDVQTKVLARTRQKLEQLQQQVTALEEDSKE